MQPVTRTPPTQHALKCMGSGGRGGVWTNARVDCGRQRMSGTPIAWGWRAGALPTCLPPPGSWTPLYTPSRLQPPSQGGGGKVLFFCPACFFPHVLFRNWFGWPRYGRKPPASIPEAEASSAPANSPGARSGISFPRIAIVLTHHLKSLTYYTGPKHHESVSRTNQR